MCKLNVREAQIWFLYFLNLFSMDVKKTSLEEKISKLAEHGESLKKTESPEKLPGAPEATETKFEAEKKESQIGKIEPTRKTVASSQDATTQQRVVGKTVKDLKKLDKTNQMKSLVSLSFNKGIFFAVEVAKDLDDPYILDELHDELVKQYRELVKNGKLKAI